MIEAVPKTVTFPEMIALDAVKAVVIREPVTVKLLVKLPDPETSKVAEGLVVPIPTLPPVVTRILSIPATVIPNPLVEVLNSPVGSLKVSNGAAAVPSFCIVKFC